MRSPGIGGMEVNMAGRATLPLSFLDSTRTHAPHLRLTAEHEAADTTRATDYIDYTCGASIRFIERIHRSRNPNSTR